MIVFLGALLVWVVVGTFVWLDVRTERRLLRHLERLDRERR